MYRRLGWHPGGGDDGILEGEAPCSIKCQFQDKDGVFHLLDAISPSECHPVRKGLNPYFIPSGSHPMGVGGRVRPRKEAPIGQPPAPPPPPDDWLPLSPVFLRQSVLFPRKEAPLSLSPPPLPEPAIIKPRKTAQTRFGENHDFNNH